MLNKKLDCDDEFQTDFNYKQNIIVKNKLDYVPKVYTINFFHDFDDPRYYLYYFKVIEEAHEEDDIVFYFNSPGGDINTLNLFLNALRRCKSKNVLARVNYAASAAALLALYCDNIEFNVNATLMLHTWSGVRYGKGQEIESDLNHSKKNYESMLRYICKKILTDEEIEQMINGKDFYFDGEEAVKRLKARAQEKLKEQKKKKHESK